jgi:hypothetical protein
MEENNNNNKSAFGSLLWIIFPLFWESFIRFFSSSLSPSLVLSILKKKNKKVSMLVRYGPGSIVVNSVLVGTMRPLSSVA